MTKWKTLSTDGETITLKKFHSNFQLRSEPEWNQANQKDNLCLAAVLDIETTGTDFKSDRIIEVGIRTFTFHRSLGWLVLTGESYSGLEDPGFPLRPEISEITGLTDADLSGQKIDWQKVLTLLNSADLVIAHNASFDRPFVDKRLLELGLPSKPLIWGCSLKQVQWAQKGFNVQKLEILCAFHGFFVDAHRALNDADACLHLISQTDTQSGNAYLAELYAQAHIQQIKVIATGSPFESKDELRLRGYRWDTLKRVWSTTLPQAEQDKEIQWLETRVYGGPFKGSVFAIPLTQSFSKDV